MEVKFNIPDELVEEIAQRVISKLMPLLSKQNNPDNDILFDVKGLCEYLNVSDKWVYERTHQNEIPFIKVGGLLRFRKKDIDRWLNSYHTPAVDTPKRTLRAVK